MKKEDWIRVCPGCGKILKKKTLRESVNCTCGWVWKGKYNGKERT